MSRLAPWFTAVIFALLVAAKFDPATGFTPLIRFGAAHEATRLPALQEIPHAQVANSSGYDGQFYAQIALAPALRDPDLANALDAPAYRARRILTPAAAHVLGMGNPRWVLQAYALLNVACWFAFAAILYREIDPAAKHLFARWIACVFSLGVLESVRQSLVDLPALLLLLIAVRAARQPVSPPWRSNAWSALGHLAKETNLLATVALAADSGVRGLRPRLLWCALSVVPLLCWLGYVSTRFPAGETGFGNFTWPLAGAISQLRVSLDQLASGNVDSRHLFAAVAIPGLFLQAGALLWHRATRAPWWRIGLAYGLLLLVLGPWVWSGYWAACRAVLPLTIAFNLLLPANRAFWPLWTLGNLSLLHGIWRFL